MIRDYVTKPLQGAMIAKYRNIVMNNNELNNQQFSIDEEISGTKKTVSKKYTVSESNQGGARDYGKDGGKSMKMC
jgi:hypothetical protein